MEESLLKRIEQLLMENKKLHNMYVETKNKLAQTNNNLIDATNEIVDLNNLLNKYKCTNRKLQVEMKTVERKLKQKILVVKNECKRKDILSKKLIGSNKDSREIELKNELNKEYSRNYILTTFIQQIFDNADEDFEVFYNVLQIIEDSSDDCLRVFAQNLKKSIMK